ALRVAVLGFLALTIFAVLFLRLWALQVLSGDKYLAQANNNRVRKLPLDAQRGLILDRDGRVLVKNTLGTSIELWPADLPKNPHQSLAAHVLGYVGEITKSQLKAKRSEGYKLGDVIGQAGIESSYDKYLRGTAGSAQLTVDSRGRPTSAIEPKITPRPGNTI